jgi:hypothetical protein
VVSHAPARNELRRRRFVAVVICVSASLALAPPPAEGGSRSGPEIAIFSRCGDALPEKGQRERTPYCLLAHYLRDGLQDRFSIVLRKTPGSLDTLIEMDARGPEPGARVRPALGFVQSDVLFHYVNGSHPQLPLARKTSEVRTVARVLREWVFFSVTKAHAERLRGVPDPFLRARAVCVGRLGSGSLVTALNLRRILAGSAVEVYGCDPKNRESKDWEMGVYVQAPDRKLPVSSLFLTEDSAEVAASAFPAPVLYRTVEVPAGGSRSGSGTHTLTVDGVLVANTAVPYQVVRAASDLIEGICTKRVAVSDPPVSAWHLRNETRICRSGEKSARYDALPVAKHRAQIEKRLGLASWLLVRFTSFGVLRVFVFLVAFLAVISTIPGMLERIRRGDRPEALLRHAYRTRKGWLFLGVGFVVFHAFLAVLIWLTEYHDVGVRSDSAFLERGIGGAFAWVYSLFVTRSGPVQLESMWAVFWVGVLKAGWGVTGIALTVGLSKRFADRWEKRHMSELDGHVIVVGFNRRWENVVAELGRQHGVEFACANWRDELPLKVAGGRPIVHHKIGGNRMEALKKLGVARARAIIVLADRDQAQAAEEDVDLWLCKLVREIRDGERAWENESGGVGRRHRYIVCEAMRPRNVGLLRDNGADEVICVRAFGVQLLAHAATKRRVMDVFSDLLDTDPRSDELYFERLDPADFADGNLFVDVARVRMKRKQATTDQQIPIGVRRRLNGSGPALATGAERFKIILNPEGDDAKVDPVTDELIVVRKQGAVTPG